MEIIKKEDNGIEFYTIDLTGQSGMSQSGLAILAGVSQPALSQLENTLISKAPSEYLEPFVGKELTLISNDVTIKGKPVGNLKIYKASYCAAVLKHYALPPRSNVVAIASSFRFVEMGINSWIQNITGWKLRYESLKPYTDVYITRIEHSRDHRIDDNLWGVFKESSDLLLLLEKDWRIPINQYDIADGSIGKRWAKYREDKPWAAEVGSYIHQYRDQRGARPCAAYKYEEIAYFRQWLREKYIPTYLPDYLIEKYGRQAVRLIYTENQLLNDKILELTEIKRLTPQESQSFQDFKLSRQSLLGGS